MWNMVRHSTIPDQLRKTELIVFPALLAGIRVLDGHRSLVGVSIAVSAYRFCLPHRGLKSVHGTILIVEKGIIRAERDLRIWFFTDHCSQLTVHSRSVTIPNPRWFISMLLESSLNLQDDCFPKMAIGQSWGQTQRDRKQKHSICSGSP